MSFKNILVPYNGSVGAKKGLLTAIELASLTKGKITILTCIETRSILSFLRPKNYNKEYEREKELFEKEFSLIKKDIRKLNISFKFEILKSSFAANSISDYVKSNDIDTVVLGKSPLKGTEKTYHESMANYLTMRINCPMIIVK